MPTVSMTVNGKAATGDVEGRTLLVHFLRDKLGSDRHPCRLRHQPMRRLRRPCRRQVRQILHAAGAPGRTAPRSRRSKGWPTNGELHPMQAAFREHHGLQCGFCTPGMVMSAVDLARRNGDPSGKRSARVAGRQHLPLHRLSQHRQGRAGRREGDEEIGPWPTPTHIPASALPSGARKTIRLLTGSGTYTDDINRHGQTHAYILRSPHASAKINQDRHRQGEEGARRGCDLHRRGLRRRRQGRPSLRLADPQQGWLADGRAAASPAGGRYRAPCRRPCRAWSSPRPRPRPAMPPS